MATSGETLGDADMEAEEVEEEADEIELTDTNLITEALSVGVLPSDVATLSSERAPQEISVLNQGLDLTSSLQKNGSTTRTNPLTGISHQNKEQLSPSQTSNTSPENEKDSVSASILRKGTDKSSPSQACCSPSPTQRQNKMSPQDNMNLPSAKTVQRDVDIASPSHACCSPPPTQRQNTRSPQDNMNLASAKTVERDIAMSSPSHACCSSSSTTRQQNKIPEENCYKQLLLPSSSVTCHQDLESYAAGTPYRATQPFLQHSEHNDSVTQVAGSKEGEGNEEDVPNVFTLFPQLVTRYPIQQEVIDRRMSTTEVTRTLAEMHAKADFSHMKQASRLIPPQRVHTRLCVVGGSRRGAG